MTVLPVRTAISVAVHSREFRVVGCPDGGGGGGGGGDYPDACRGGTFL